MGKLNSTEEAHVAADGGDGGEETAVSIGPVLSKYLNHKVADFGDSYDHLPDDVDAFDPRLLDPAAGPQLARAARDHRRHLRDRDRELGQLDAARRRAFLDPRLPLLQLFWQTLLPWNVVNDEWYVG